MALHFCQLLGHIENDGNKDLFISNGYLRDHTDMDFLQYTADEVLKINKGEEHVDFQGHLAAMPPILQPNYFYQNQGEMTFANQTAAWSPGEAQVTQGAAYADFDNDGDLDMVWNNSGETATVLKNNADRLFQNNYLKVRLKGNKGNPQGIGAKVKISAGKKIYYQEQNPIRGFQTSVDPILNFGLGKEDLIESLVVEWPMGNKQVFENIKVNQTLTLEEAQASGKSNSTVEPPAYFKKLSPQTLDYVHQENLGNDLKKQFLLPYFYSRQGPGTAVGDVDGDGKEDLILGNAQGQARKLFLQKEAYNFQEKNSPAFTQDAASEDVALHLFDADADTDLDLYAVSGGYHWAPGDPGTQDCLYLNDGQGNFTKQNSLPEALKPHSCVASADVDQDGDLDLFIGGAVLPYNYPLSSPSHLLLNNGDGTFKKDSNQVFNFAGIVSSVKWINLNGDAYPDLVVAGEWMPIQFYENQKGKLTKVEASTFQASGLWNTIHAADFDQDNDLDLVVGNFGYNSQWSASPSEPLQLYYGDFDANRSVDPILCYYVGGQSYPFVSREDLTNQMPPVKRNFNYFKDYANAQITDVLSPEQLAAANKLSVENLETIYLENEGGKFVKKSLPLEAMIAPVHAIESMDVNGDGHLDIILAGNISQARVKLGKLDGNHGLILLGDGQGHFTKLPDAESGILVKGDVRNIFKLKQEDWLLGFGVNNDACQIYTLQSQN